VAAGDWYTNLIGIQQIRKVDSCWPADTMESPGSRIDIQQLELAVPGVLLELHFHQAIEVDVPEKAFRELCD
jgi:hypothetical protein